MHHLIHNSSEHGNLTEASVEIIFANGDGYLSLKRTVYSTSTSKYQLNNMDTTLENVTNELKSYGLDIKHNNFMVL